MFINFTVAKRHSNHLACNRLNRTTYALSGLRRENEKQGSVI